MPPVLVTDTSVIVNFLRIRQLPLLGQHPSRIVITDHIRAEISRRWQDQWEYFDQACRDGIVECHQVENAAAHDLFRRLNGDAQLGCGESEAIAYAITHDYAIATDDKWAIHHARRLAPELDFHTTQDLVVALIRGNKLDISAADAMKDEWAARHRFRLKIGSFAELVG